MENKQCAKPAHYAALGKDVIDYCFENKVPFAEGNVIKYTLRHINKNGIEDLRKAQDYLRRMAKHYYNEEL